MATVFPHFSNQAPERPTLELEEIEITPQMIEAGVDVFLDSYPEAGARDFMDYEMVRGIFSAMIAIKNFPSSD